MRASSEGELRNQNADRFSSTSPSWRPSRSLAGLPIRSYSCAARIGASCGRFRYDKHQLERAAVLENLHVLLQVADVTAKLIPHGGEIVFGGQPSPAL